MNDEKSRAQWLVLREIEDDSLRARFLALHARAISKDQADATLAQDEVLIRWPRLVSHLICKSLGYFSPRAAANAILFHLAGRPFHCEWYTHIGSCQNGDRSWPGEAQTIAIGKEVLEQAITCRHSHDGYMSSYARGLRVIASELCGHGPVLASWF